MTEKKETVKKTATPKAAAEKKAAPKRTTPNKVHYEINAESVAFRPGAVHQALATARNALSGAETAKAAKIAEEEALLGMGWLFKEGKIKAEENKITLA